MYNYTWRIPLAFISPCRFPFVSPLPPPYLLGTLLAVTGSVHLGLRLLVNWPPLSQPFTQTLPLQIPRTPTAQRLTKTTSGIIRRLLSGTIIVMWLCLIISPISFFVHNFCLCLTHATQIIEAQMWNIGAIVHTVFISGDNSLWYQLCALMLCVFSTKDAPQILNSKY